MIETLECYWH